MKLVQIVTMIAYALKIIGLAPFSRQAKTSAENSRNSCRVSVFRFSKLGLAYNFLILIIIQVTAVFAIPTSFSVSYPNSSTSTLIMDIVQGIVCCFTTDAIIISWAFRQHNAARIMNKLLEIDRLLSGLEEEPLSYKRIFIFPSVEIIFSACVSITFIATEARMLSDAILFFTFVCLPIFVIYWFVIEYFLVVRLLATKFEQVNKILSKLLKFPNRLYRTPFINDHLAVFSLSSHSPFAALQLLVVIRTRLAEAAQDIADFFSFPILLSVGCSFIILVYSLYYLISPVLVPGSDFRLIATFDGILWILISVYPLALLSFIVTKARDKAKLTARIVHELLAIPTRRAIKAKLRQFSLQLLHEDVTFTAYGFFTLDFTMLHSIFGGAATYLVILIQFQLPGNPANDTSPARSISLR